MTLAATVTLAAMVLARLRPRAAALLAACVRALLAEALLAEAQLRALDDGSGRLRLVHMVMNACRTLDLRRSMPLDRAAALGAMPPA